MKKIIFYIMTISLLFSCMAANNKNDKDNVPPKEANNNDSISVTNLTEMEEELIENLKQRIYEEKLIIVENKDSKNIDDYLKRYDAVADSCYNIIDSIKKMNR